VSYYAYFRYYFLKYEQITASILKFDEFWQKRRDLLRAKNNFATFTRGDEFEAKNTVDGIVVIPTSTGKKRPVRMEEFHKIWDLCKDSPIEIRFKPGEYQFNTRNASYILTIMKEIIGNTKME